MGKIRCSRHCCALGTDPGVTGVLSQTWTRTLREEECGTSCIYSTTGISCSDKSSLAILLPFDLPSDV